MKLLHWLTRHWADPYNALKAVIAMLSVEYWEANITAVVDGSWAGNAWWPDKAIYKLKGIGRGTLLSGRILKPQCQVIRSKTLRRTSSNGHCIYNSLSSIFHVPFHVPPTPKTDEMYVMPSSEQMYWSDSSNLGDLTSFLVISRRCLMTSSEISTDVRGLLLYKRRTSAKQQIRQSLERGNTRSLFSQVLTVDIIAKLVREISVEIVYKLLKLFILLKPHRNTILGVQICEKKL